MDNNDIMRNLRYTFDYNDDKMILLCSTLEKPVTRTQVCDWLKKEGAAGYVECPDLQMSIFLNSFITQRRGKKEGPDPIAEPSLTNNIVFRKLRIALDLKDEDILEILALADFKLSKGELSAFFRKPGHNNFRKCKDQILRNFLTGVRAKFRPEKSED